MMTKFPNMKKVKNKYDPTSSLKVKRKLSFPIAREKVKLKIQLRRFKKLHVAVKATGILLFCEMKR